QAVYFACGIAGIDGAVPPFTIPKRLVIGAQALRESSARLARKNEKNAEDRPCRLLRARRERPRGCRAADERDELATRHSITSSATCRRCNGRSSPHAFAPFGLMASSETH